MMLMYQNKSCYPFPFTINISSFFFLLYNSSGYIRQHRCLLWYCIICVYRRLEKLKLLFIFLWFIMEVQFLFSQHCDKFIYIQNNSYKVIMLWAFYVTIVVKHFEKYTKKMKKYRQKYFFPRNISVYTGQGC